MHFLADCPLGGVFTPIPTFPPKGEGVTFPPPFRGRARVGVNAPPSLSAGSTPADQEVRYPNSIGSGLTFDIPAPRRLVAQAYWSGHYTLAQVGKYFGVSYATVSRAVKQAEGRG